MALQLGKVTAPKLKGVIYNTGMQSSANPQKAAGASAVQNAAGAKKIQSTASGNTIQPAAAPVQSAADVARAAAEIAAATAREIERQRQEKRQQIQTQINLKVSTNRADLQSTVSKNVLRLGKIKTSKLVIPKLSAEDKARSDAYTRGYNRAAKDIANKKEIGKKRPFWQKLGDKLTFGQDRREAAAREYAENVLSKKTKKEIDDYKKSVNNFQSEQAKRKAAIEAAKFGSESEWRSAVESYSNWQKSQIKQLTDRAGSLEGATDAYGKASQSKLTSAAAKALGFVTTTAQSGGPLGKVWQYTLGEGSKNTPSLVTGLSRAVNFIGNVNTQDRNIYKIGGDTAKRSAGVKAAWQATYGQRNFNIRPWTDKKSADAAIADEVKSLINARRAAGVTDPAKLDYDKVYKQRLAGYNQSNRVKNSILEVAADPLNIAGGAGAIARGTGAAAKIAATLRGTKIATKTGNLIKSVKDTSAFKWLNAEAKSPGKILADAVAEAKAGTANAQKNILSQVTTLNKQLGHDLDVSVFDDFEKLTDDEAKVLQRMVDGKLAARDRVMLATPGNKPIRQKLIAIAAKWQDFAEQMQAADQVTKTRFGRGKKFYAPRVDYGEGHNLENYNFYKKKNAKIVQSARDLRTNAIDRYFKSDLDSVFASTQKNKRIKRDDLLKEYDATVEPLNAKVRDAVKGTVGIRKHVALRRAGAMSPVSFGRAAANSTRSLLHAPTDLWKKSVLKYRPAWYVNNYLYNTQAAVLSGGPRALFEQMRYIRPRNYHRATKDIPAEVLTNLANETGTGRLSRVASRVENVSRVAAYTALKKQGYADDAALKRVNKYLLDYSTKNWERPIKAAVPFWNFQKGIAKAAAQMPFDRPAAAIGYNRLDQYQDQQFNKDFDSMIPKLKELGYSDEDIEKLRVDNAKYYKGRLKVGNRYYSTPFNAFSEKGLSNLGLNPILASLGETSTATDNFGRQLKGGDASLWSRLTSKVPQLQLAKEAKFKLDVSRGKRPVEQWIGKPGSEGYGLTKEAQGYDPKQKNYRKTLDKGAKLVENTTAFLGVPRSSVFDKDKLIERKTMQKLKEEYFAVDWKSLEFPDAEAKRNAMFKKYGVTRDQFFDGELAKYDDQNTKNIKKMKDDAYKKTHVLFEEYSKQPRGTRSVWATQKLKQLVDTGYFDKNPFLKSFDWLTPETVKRAYKKVLYDRSKTSGDWSEYNRVFGDTRRRSSFVYNGKYFKSAESMKKYKDGEFWRKYSSLDATGRRQLLRDNKQYAKREVKSEDDIAVAKFWYGYARANPETRRSLLAQNPQYNKRANWTDEMWDKWRVENKQLFKDKARSISSISANEKENLRLNQAMALLFNGQSKRTKKVKYALR